MQDCYDIFVESCFAGFTGTCCDLITGTCVVFLISNVPVYVLMCLCCLHLIYLTRMQKKLNATFVSVYVLVAEFKLRLLFRKVLQPFHFTFQ